MTLLSFFEFHVWFHGTVIMFRRYSWVRLCARLRLYAYQHFSLNIVIGVNVFVNDFYFYIPSHHFIFIIGIRINNNHSIFHMVIGFRCLFVFNVNTLICKRFCLNVCNLIEIEKKLSLAVNHTKKISPSYNHEIDHTSQWCDKMLTLTVIVCELFIILLCCVIAFQCN